MMIIMQAKVSTPVSAPANDQFFLLAKSLLPHRRTKVSGLAVSVAPDVVVHADPIKRRAGDPGFGRGSEIMAIPLQMSKQSASGRAAVHKSGVA